MKRRWLALLLTVVMLTGLLAGCGGSGGNEDTDADSGEKTAATQGKEMSVKSETPAIDFDAEPYEATFMYWAGNDARDLASVQEAFNKLTMEQLNMKVNLMPMTFGTYMQQIQMILSSDDKLDIFPYFSSNMGSYISSDYLVNLNEYLDTCGQDMIRIIGREDINCCGIGDFIGGVPTMHERTNPVTYVLRTDLLEESGFTAADIKTARDLAKVFAKVKELHPDMVMYGGANNLTYPVMVSNAIVDPMGGGNFGVLMDNGQSTTVTNWYETEEFMDACRMMREWYQAGYTSADLATCTDSGESLMRAGNLFCFSTSGKPNTKAEKDAMTGYDTTCVKVTPDVCYTTATNSVLYGISSNSEDPKKAMILLNWIYNTKEANDLINWGIEGKDYVLTEDGTIDYPDGITAENVGYHQDFGWALPNQYNSYIWTGNEADLWEQYQQVRDSAQVSKAYGFHFDTSPVVDTLSALTAISDEYLITIGSGSVDPETAVAEFNEMLYSAGLQDVIDSKQEQLNAWLEKQ